MITLLMLTALAFGPTLDLEIASGEHLAVRDEGKGPTVVLVPGLTGCCYGFRQVVPGLTGAGRRTVVIEPLGIGASARPAHADYSLTAQADRLAAVMDSLRTGPAVVVGHGVSGSMVLRLALRRPDLVAAVVSIEGGPDERAATPTVKRALGLASFAVKVGAGRVLRDRFRAGLENASGDRAWIDGITLRRYFAGTARDVPAALAALRAMADAEEPQSLQANLSAIRCPVLLLLGGADHEGGPDDSAVALLRERLPDLQVAGFPGGGHYLFEEDPAGVVRAILDLPAGGAATVASATSGRSSP